ncbi:hypothetical protein GH714_024098 [Hevea brasiliensis]|uniref:Uncharacterized protein n=1 Tax=Hevea brasiliensis TaxID=3981 RepID=A0A6A6LUS2_HEVBR|nr:hypothetical protein GH714_024098 [Hevea brasiliensis]
MSFCSSLSTPRSPSLLSKSKPFKGDNKPAAFSVGSRFRGSVDVPDFLSANCLVKRKPCSTSSLKYNDQPHPDYGMEVMFKRVGGSWVGYWLTESLLNDGDPFVGGLAY